MYVKPSKYLLIVSQQGMRSDIQENTRLAVLVRPELQRALQKRSFRVGVRILHGVIFSFKIIYFHRYITLD